MKGEEKSSEKAKESKKIEPTTKFDTCESYKRAETRKASKGRKPRAEDKAKNKLIWEGKGTKNCKVPKKGGNRAKKRGIYKGERDLSEGGRELQRSNSIKRRKDWSSSWEDRISHSIPLR